MPHRDPAARAAYQRRWAAANRTARLDAWRRVDHVVPRSRGGADAEANRVAACRRCNARKGAKTAAEFTSWLRARGELPPRLGADGLPDWSLDDLDAERALTRGSG